MKEKTAKMKRCAAGVHIPEERAVELVEAALDFDAREIIQQLESMGVEVVSAYLVKGGN